MRYQELLFSASVLGAAIALNNCRHPRNMRPGSHVFQSATLRQINHPLGRPIAGPERIAGVRGICELVCRSDNQFSELVGDPRAFGMARHSYFPATPWSAQQSTYPRHVL